MLAIQKMNDVETTAKISLRARSSALKSLSLYQGSAPLIRHSTRPGTAKASGKVIIIIGCNVHDSSEAGGLTYNKLNVADFAPQCGYRVCSIGF